jgi:hypothetical protein
MAINVSHMYVSIAADNNHMSQLMAVWCTTDNLIYVNIVLSYGFGVSYPSSVSMGVILLLLCRYSFYTRN